MKKALLVCLCALICAPLGHRLQAEPAPDATLASYRAELDLCRETHGGARELPDVPFFLFGMGARTKLLYRKGALIDIKSGSELRRWNVQRELIVPPSYGVWLETAEGQHVEISEDAEAVWINEGGQRTAIKNTHSPVHLPDFQGKKYPLVLRVLHQEILLNITEAGPLPNLFVYRNPWYRDAAMMAMVLKKTGNVDLLRPWVLSLREPFDGNNAGITEPDNLGQLLFLVSLVSDKTHPAVPGALAAAAKFEVNDAMGKYIKGQSDFREHPVYQTKWLKYGLRALGLPDTYTIPRVADSYSTLFWMDYRDEHVSGGDSADRGNYPYLGWACDHFHNTRKSPISNRDYPLTWEINASQADYKRMQLVDPTFAKQKTSVPHTWHAAEVFLLLLKDEAESKR